ncbi:uncharacterized protein TRAVEDRAFT_68950 [Trametes versicolor FP-101664 SS1]|uniref:uncharacterized protein n=1 Tax=Trametes versicolor (strain FP-101664) TaxID=717944 RepID=UPI0004623F93|nr:uncharacterized protein TRAVEDRAFT_68950 [Trametes versicolor FP-101664 SS1]EIW62564.1 hypothetical protein TRAVEDRAFT_68950 [Trametes versicolor FP-101664 SS1]
MSDFNLAVNIDPAVLPILIDAGYKLCIAKKVNNQYTVVWQGSNILPFNQFTWSAKYQVFGQTATLDKYGVMHPATGTVDQSGKFTVENQFGLINLGVNSYVNGTYSPSYVSANPVVAGPTVLQPIESVLVWFDTQATTGTMILNASSQAIEVDFTSVPTHTLLYQTPSGAPAGRGVWYLDSDQAVLPMTYHVASNSFTIPEPDEGQLALMTELLNRRPRLRPAFTTSVVAAAEYESKEEGARFKDYLSASRPEGFAQWEVYRSDRTISVKMEVEIATDEEASVRSAMDKYLKILYAFDGTRYKTLTSTVHGRPVEPLQTDYPVPPVDVHRGNGKPPSPDTITATAVVRFHDDKKASAFSEQLNDATSPGIKFEATARGPAITIKFEAKGPKEGAQKRVRQAYDAAVAAFGCMPGGAEPVYVGSIVWMIAPLRP